jgi:magnesium chelatase family protein
MFLDEATEFRRDALEALRGPIEDGAVTIVRSRFAVTYPARFQLVAAANPCPCGYRNDPVRECRCLPGRVAAHDERLSGPIVDRLDIRITVPRLQRREIFAAADGERSPVVRERVEAARRMQTERLRPFGLTCNAEVSARLLDDTCRRTPAARVALERSIEKHRLTARSAHRMLKVARTIADLNGCELVDRVHVEQAAHYQKG